MWCKCAQVNHCALREQRLSFKVNPFLLLYETDIQQEINKLTTQSLSEDKNVTDSAFYENVLTASSVSAPIISFNPPQTHTEGFNLKHRNIRVRDKTANMHSSHSCTKSSHRHCEIERLISLSTTSHFQQREPQTPVCKYVTTY